MCRTPSRRRVESENLTSQYALHPSKGAITLLCSRGGSCTSGPQRSVPTYSCRHHLADRRAGVISQLLTLGCVSLYLEATRVHQFFSRRDQSRAIWTCMLVVVKRLSACWAMGADHWVDRSRATPEGGMLSSLRNVRLKVSVPCCTCFHG